MINVVGSTPSPVSPLPPDLPGDLPTESVQSPMASTETASPADSGATKPTSPPKKSKLSGKYLLGGALLLLLVIGSGIGLYLIKLNQDLRQQAQVYDEPGGGCGPGSGAQCQGRSPGDRCGNNAPYGTCEELSDGDCTCRRAEEEDIAVIQQPTSTPTPTATPTATPTEEPVNCQDFGTIDTCDANNPPCAWYACSGSCWPTGTSNEDAGCTTEDTTDEEQTNDEEDDGDTIASANSSSNAEANITINEADEETGTGGQPTLPSQLPQTGPEDWLKYLQIGLGVLGAGALLLLFL